MRSLALLVLALAACGSKKTGSDCDAAVQRGVDVTISKRRGSNAGTMSAGEAEVPAKLKAALTKACTDDKWSKEVLECFKTAEDIATCKAQLTPEQRANYTKAAMGVMMGSGAGGSNMSMPAHGMGMSGGGSGASAPPSGSGGSVPLAEGGLPQACRDYAEAQDKAMKCAAMPQPTKDALQASYDDLSKSFKEVAAKGTDDQKKQLANFCSLALGKLKEVGPDCGI